MDQWQSRRRTGGLGLLDPSACWRRGSNKRKWSGPCRLAQEPGKNLTTEALQLSGQHPAQGHSGSSGGLLLHGGRGIFLSHGHQDPVDPKCPCRAQMCVISAGVLVFL